MNKKLLIFLTIFSSILLFNISSVKAADNRILNEDTPIIPVSDINIHNLRYEDYNFEDLDINTISYAYNIYQYTKEYAIEYLDTHSEFSDYIIYLSNGNGNNTEMTLLFIKPDYNNKIKFHVNQIKKDTWSHYMNFQLFITINQNEIYDKKIFKFNYNTNNEIYLYQDNYGAINNSNTPRILLDSSLHYYIYSKYGDTIRQPMHLIIDTSLDIIYSTDYATNYNQVIYKKLILEENSETYEFSNNDVISNNNEWNTIKKLKYKTGFNTNGLNELGKVSVEFSEFDSTISNNYNAKFKLQFGSNDWTKENIPIFSHFKIFGRYNENTNWLEIDLDNLNNELEATEEDKIEFTIMNTTFDFVENALADSSIEFNFKFLETINTLYNEWRIEFYLDNTRNGYVYVYDNLKNSSWDDTSKFLNDYIYYYFPSEYQYAYISSSNEDNEGKVYFPTFSINDERISLTGQYFDLNKKIYSSPINYYQYIEDDYYSYFDFKFKSSEKILSLARFKGSKSYKSFYDGNNNITTTGGQISSFLKLWLDCYVTIGGNIKESSLFEYVEENEDIYFYAPIGYDVTFSNDKDSNVYVETSNGLIEIDKGIENIYSPNELNKDKQWFEIVKDSLKMFISPIANIFRLITLVFNSLPLILQYLFISLFGFTIFYFLLRVLL